MIRKAERYGLKKHEEEDEQNHAPYGVSYTCVECAEAVIPGDPHFENELCEECYHIDLENS